MNARRSRAGAIRGRRSACRRDHRARRQEYRAGAAARARQGQPRRQRAVRARRRRPLDPLAHLHRADAREAAPATASSSGVSSARSRNACSTAIRSWPMRWRCIKNRLPPNIEVDEFFFQAGTRLAVPASQQQLHFRQLHPRARLCARPRRQCRRAARRRSALRDGETRYSLSCNTDITLDLLARRRAAGCAISVRRAGELRAAVHARRRRYRRRRVRFHAGRPRNATFRCSRRRASRSISPNMPPACMPRGWWPTAARLQLGIGSLGDAVAQALILRHRLQCRVSRHPRAARSCGHGRRRHCARARRSSRASWRQRDVRRRLSRPDAGGDPQARGRWHACCTRRSSSARAPSIARCGRCPSRSCAKLRMTAVSFVNELYGDDEPAKRRARVNARFINNAMMATLLGARGLRRARGRPGRERRRRTIQFRRPELRAGGRPLHHHAARDPRRQRPAPLRISAGITGTRPSRAICATSS